MEFKKHFSDDELKQLVGWFEEHMERLPDSLQLDRATFIKDLKHTVKLYFDVVKLHKDNPTYSGQIYLLYQIKACLEAQAEAK